jgi:hypothetical protein
VSTDYAPGTAGITSKVPVGQGVFKTLPPGCYLRVPEGTLEGPADIWDLDSSLYSTEHRHPLIDKIKAGEATWDDYSRACPQDTVLRGPLALMQARAQHALQIVITGRAEGAREMTLDNFRRDKVPADLLVMRPDGDDTHNGVFKVAEIRKLQAQGIVVQLVFEDWGPAARHIESELDVPVVGLNPFYTESTEHGSEKPEGAV